jgi:hypothetical protein
MTERLMAMTEGLMVMTDGLMAMTEGIMSMIGDLETTVCKLLLGKKECTSTYYSTFIMNKTPDGGPNTD